MAQTVKRLPTMRETRVQSLGQEYLLEKEMATHSSILACKIPWMKEPSRLQSRGVAKSLTQLSDFTFTFNIEVTGFKLESYPDGIMDEMIMDVPLKYSRKRCRGQG